MAREEIETRKPTGAVVDINLRLGVSFALAALLNERGIPFIFLTGYDEEAIPPKFKNIARLQKPLEMRKVVAAVAQAVQ